MKSDEAQNIEFVELGSFSPRDAEKLLECFEQAAISFRLRERKPLPQPGPTAAVDISVDSARAADAARIHAELFGDGLPNYESSFFRDLHNV
jgi:hypothetical protein